ncbi:MAG: phage Gp37/Gp68 family protein [Planctomycetota bacterium]|nr:MAG: phage Gp37/Gp68 family protein [Planctomycetota bacterium]REK25976.1 MAG: phage Gp37/Gp68 family protein [Planctomycetota bacterium]REK46909.1 MAG: phage Gp37/Gp68 family protein [Planctomycetota bacterium]
MAQNSSIEWTEATWNPTTGCTKISPGCSHCYAERMAFRLRRMGQPRYRNAFRLTLQEDLVERPLHWKKPRLIFVNSMSDLFHVDVPAEFVQRCFNVMQQASQHVFQLLTKRPERAAEMAEKLCWSHNVWLGTSVESQRYTGRIAALRDIPAAVRFLSLEPLLGPIDPLPLDGIQWVIAGGESGPGARPMQPEWVRQIRDECTTMEVPFFFKQWGAFGPDGVRRSKKANGRELDGQVWNEMPSAAAEHRSSIPIVTPPLDRIR